ncbi:MAG: hypothetical protein WC376_00100 [Candidatus Nanoarchaeia archaeon]|jgi:hypothetical protein
MIELSEKIINIKIAYYNGNNNSCENSGFNYREFFGNKKEINSVKKGSITYNIHLIYLDTALEYNNNKAIKNYLNGSYVVILENRNNALEELAKTLSIKTCLLNSNETIESAVYGFIDEVDEKLRKEE